MKIAVKVIMLLIPALFAAGCRTVPTLKDAKGDTPEEAMQSLANRYLEMTGNSGIVAAAVLPASSNIVVKAGVADPARPEMPLNGKTLFELASLTKDIVALAVLGAAKDGRVNLDAPVTAYTEYPLPAVYGTVTLRDLLNHQTGLPREALGITDIRAILTCWLFGEDIYVSSSTREGLFKTLCKEECVRSVKRRKPHYSNLGFGLLGILVENATGESMPGLVNQYVTQPLHMHDTTFSPDAAQRQRLASALAGDIPILTARGHQTKTHTLGGGLRSTGGLYSTADDMTLFLQYYRKIIKGNVNPSEIPFQDDGKLRFNHALCITPEKHRILCRWGMYYGYATFAGFDIDNGSALLLLRNNTDWPDDLGITFLRALSRFR